MPLAEHGAEGAATVGWTVEAPRLSWRYRRDGRGTVVTMTWNCPSLPRAWAERLRERHPELPCHPEFPPGSGDPRNLVCRLLPRPLPENGTEDDERLAERGLCYQGELALGAPIRQPALPAVLGVSLRPPLVLWNNGTPQRNGGEHRARLPVTADVRDAVAVVDGRPTRFVAAEDAGTPFQVRLTTDGETLLPGVLPAGLVAGLPWCLTVTTDDGAPDGGASNGGRRRGGRQGRAKARLPV